MSIFIRTSAGLAAAAALMLTAAPVFAAEAPVAPPTCLALSRDLEVGARDTVTASPDVSRLQAYLILAGYLSSAQPTGFFGSMTSAAVAKFQAQHGLPAHGFVGTQTRSALTNASCPNSFAFLGVQAPTHLTAGQEATWIVGVTAPSNSTTTLSYKANWGDEQPGSVTIQKIDTISPKSRIAYLTFTHTYATAGMYSPTFTFFYGGQTLPIRLSASVQ